MSLYKSLRTWLSTSHRGAVEEEKGKYLIVYMLVWTTFFVWVIHSSSWIFFSYKKWSTETNFFPHCTKIGCNPTKIGCSRPYMCAWPPATPRSDVENMCFYPTWRSKRSSVHWLHQISWLRRNTLRPISPKGIPPFIGWNTPKPKETKKLCWTIKKLCYFHLMTY